MQDLFNVRGYWYIKLFTTENCVFVTHRYIIISGHVMDHTEWIKFCYLFLINGQYPLVLSKRNMLPFRASKSWTCIGMVPFFLFTILFQVLGPLFFISKIDIWLQRHLNTSIWAIWVIAWQGLFQSLILLHTSKS